MHSRSADICSLRLVEYLRDISGRHICQFPAVSLHHLHRGPTTWEDASKRLLIVIFIITSLIIIVGAKPYTDQGRGVKKGQNNEDSVPQSDYRQCSADCSEVTKMFSAHEAVQRPTWVTSLLQRPINH